MIGEFTLHAILDETRCLLLDYCAHCPQMLRLDQFRAVNGHKMAFSSLKQYELIILALVKKPECGRIDGAAVIPIRGRHDCIEGIIGIDARKRWSPGHRIAICRRISHQ